MNVVISSTIFSVATTAIIILVASYNMLLVKLGLVNESSDFSVLLEILRETSDESLLRPAGISLPSEGESC